MTQSDPARQYQDADAAFLDYKYEVLEGCSFAVRGPLIDDRCKRRIACLGSAATFGRFATEPFSTLLAELLGVHVINFGVGGARPETYLNEPAVLNLCRASDLIILELMSARSYESDLFVPTKHRGKFGKMGQKYRAQFEKALNARSSRKTLLSADKAYRWAVNNLSWIELTGIRRQILESYTRDALDLMHLVDRPVVLLWFSQRPIDEIPQPGSYPSWARGFPHFLDRTVVQSLCRSASGFVDVTSMLGMPAQLVPAIDTNGRTSHLSSTRSRTSNRYYPSPAMHAEAATKLAEFLAAFLGFPRAHAALGPNRLPISSAPS